jgi:outer membrane protein
MLSQRISRLIGTALLSMFVTALSAQKQPEVHQLSVKEAIDYANKNNLQVRNALLDVQIQLQTNRDITAQALPRITGSANAQDYLKTPISLIPGEFFGQPGTKIPVSFYTKYVSNFGINLEQVLFDGSVFVGLQARKTSVDLVNKSVEVTQEMIKSNVYKTYYQLTTSKTQISLIDANLNRLNELRRVTNELFKNGFNEQLDVDKIDVQIANLETQKLKVLSQTAIGYLGLKLLMGMPTRDSLILTDTLSYEQVKEGLPNEGTYKYEDRKEFQALTLTRDLYNYNVKRYKLSYLPALRLQGSYGKNSFADEFKFFGGFKQWFTTAYAGLSLSVPIFDGFSKDANIKKAKFQVKQYENQIENEKIMIDNDVESARINFKAAVATLDYQQKNMKLAETVFNQTQKKYEVGTGSNVEITAAQTDLQQAQTNYITALYDAITAKIDYLKATGKL